MDGLKLLENKGLHVRLVSMPSWELFALQSASYRETVLPSQIRPRLAVEAASPLGWERFVGFAGAVLGMNGFGASAPAEDLARQFGFTAEKVAERALDLVAQTGASRD